MDKVKIIILHSVFTENAIVLATRLGVEIIKDFTPQTGYLYIVYGGHEKTIDLLNSQKQMGNTFGYIIMNSEPPNSQFIQNKFYLELMKNNVVFDYHNQSASYLKKVHNINVKSFHFFDFPEYKEESKGDLGFTTPEEPERTIDILFVGTKTARRETIFKKLKEAYPNKTIEFVFDWSLSAPVNMTNKLKQAQYVLNIPYHEHNILETHRINKALSCGCDVVSLYSGDKITDDFYEDYVYMTHDIVEVFNEDLTGNKKPYHELSKFLTQKLTTHNNWYISKIFENLS